MTDSTIDQKRNYETYNTTWSNIPIVIRYCKDYWASVGVSHLEVRSEEPNPITETGYRSAWIMPGELEGTNPLEYVLSALDECSKTKKWREYLQSKKKQDLAKTQLSLF